jgi:hypothetical protein
MMRLKSPEATLGIILLLALAMRLLTFDRALPFVDYPDEANMFLLAVDWRGDYPLADEYGASLTGSRLAGYPPLFPVIAVGTQYIVEAVSPEPFLFSGDYVYGIRLLAVIAGVLTTCALWVIGWSLGGLIAAALSALVWALSPVVVEWNSLAIPDPLVYLASAWTLAFALWAWHKDNPAWTLPSLLCAVAAIYLKYTPLHVLVAWGWVVLIFFRRDWRRMLPWLIVEIAIGLVSAAYLLFDYGALRLQNDEAMRLDPGMALNIARGLRNLYGTILPIGVGLFAAGLIAGIIAYIYSRQRGWLLVDWHKALYLLAITVAGILTVSTFIGVEPYGNQMRHVLPVSPAMIGLWSMGVLQGLHTLRAMQRPSLVNHVLVAVIALFAAAALPGDLALIQRFAAPDPRYQLWRWSDASLPLDGKILMHPNSRLRFVWNRPYSGYDGETAFDWAFDEAPSHSTPQELAEGGVAYFAMTRDDYSSPDMPAFLNALMPLIAIPAPPEPANDIFVYRLLPPQIQTNVTFGRQIALVGYDLEMSDEAVRFRPYWRTQQQPSVNYSMFVHLLTRDETRVVGQFDGSPASEQRPASTWDDPAELLIGADARIELPSDLPSGEYRLLVGLYDYETGQRLLLDDGSDAFEVSLSIG